MHETAARRASASSEGPPEEAGLLAAGSDVCVRDRFLGHWNGGFRVAEVLPFGYRLCRVSDGHVFEDVFSFEDVVRERRQNPLRGVDGSYLDRRRAD